MPRRELMCFLGVGRLMSLWDFDTRSTVLAECEPAIFAPPDPPSPAPAPEQAKASVSPVVVESGVPASQLTVADASFPESSYRPFESRVSIALPPLPDSSHYRPEPQHRPSHHMCCTGDRRPHCDVQQTAYLPGRTEFSRSTGRRLTPCV